MDSKQNNSKGEQGKILYILTRFPVPTETFILNELREMKRQSLSYSVFAFRVDFEAASLPPYNEIDIKQIPRPLSPEVLGASSKCLAQNPSIVLRLFKERACRRMHHFLQALFIAQWARSNGISHIHAHYAYHSTSAALVASKVSGIGYSFTAHANDIYKSCYHLEEKIMHSRFCATCTGYNAKYLKENFARQCPQKIIKVYHGIELEKFRSKWEITHTSSKPADEFVIVSVGRLREKKGFPYLIEACRRLKDKGINIKAKIIGDGPQSTELEHLIEKNNLTEDVILTGAICHDEVYDLLVKADIFVLPCIIARDGSRDGIPNVILEAMAVGLPVVSTTVSAIPEAVTHKETGLLVPPNDAAALADAIEKLYRTPELREVMGKKGRTKVEKEFELKMNTRRLIHLFKKHLNTGG